jgi:GNAT superfamily N-acetyltransferase
MLTVNNSTINVRLLKPSDSIAELTSLIQRAYERLADMGLNFNGSYQTEDVTLKRIDGGECYVAIMDGRIVATVLLYTKKPAWADGWYGRYRTAIVGQFAVEPELQNKGIGSELMDFVEKRATELGLAEIGLDTAEGALHLIQYYSKRGYRFV